MFAESTDAARNTSLAFGANLEEPMLYLTAVYPAEQVGRRRRGEPPSAEEERLWTIANDTLFGIAEYTRRWACPPFLTRRERTVVHGIALAPVGLHLREFLPHGPSSTHIDV